MDGGADLRRIVVQEVEDPLTFRVMGAHHAGGHGDIAGNQADGDNPFPQTIVFGGVLRFEGVMVGGEFLAIAARVDDTAEIIGAKERQGGNGVADDRGRGLHRFQAQIVLRGPDQPPGRQITRLAHAMETEIGPPGNQAGAEDTIVAGVVMAAPQDVFNRAHEATFTLHIGQDRIEGHLRQGFKQRVIRPFASFRRLERPGSRFAVLLDGDTRILAAGDPPIDRRELGFERLFQLGQMLGNRLLEDGRLDVSDEGVAVGMPVVERDQVIVEAAEADALRADEIAGFQGRAQGGVHIELIAITAQLGRAIRGFGVKIALQADRQTLGWDGGGGHLGQGPPTGGQILEEVDGLQEWTRGGAGIQRDGLEQGAQPAFKAERQRVNVLPDKGGFVTAGARDEVGRCPGEGSAVQQAERR